MLLGGNYATKPFVQKISDVAYEIEKSIETLPVGKSILIPGGYTNPGSEYQKSHAHAVVYQVHRIRENEFQFSIFNIGAGALFGQEFQPFVWFKKFS